MGRDSSGTHHAEVESTVSGLMESLHAKGKEPRGCIPYQTKIIWKSVEYLDDDPQRQTYSLALVTPSSSLSFVLCNALYSVLVQALVPCNSSTQQYSNG